MTERPTLFFYTVKNEATGRVMEEKGETKLYSSLQWENGYDYSGSIEIHMPFSKKMYDIATPFTIIKIDRDMKENTGIIIWRGVSLDTKGHMVLRVKAKTLSYTLSFRGIRTYGFGVSVDYLSNIISELLFANTNVENLTLLYSPVCLLEDEEFEDVKLDYTYTLPSSSQSLYGEIETLCKSNQKGFYMKLKDKAPTLVLYQKRQNNGIEFSLSAKNIISMDISSGIDNYASGFFYGDGYKLNCGGVASQDNDIYRVEKYIEVPAEVLANSEAGGFGAANSYCRQQLTAKYPMTNEISADVTQTGKCYLTDYFLGDVVPLRCEELGICAHYPISGVREIWEEGYKAEVIFGERMLTMWQKAERRYKGGF